MLDIHIISHFKLTSLQYAPLMQDKSYYVDIFLSIYSHTVSQQLLVRSSETNVS